MFCKLSVFCFELFDFCPRRGAVVFTFSPPPTVPLKMVKMAKNRLKMVKIATAAPALFKRKKCTFSSEVLHPNFFLFQFDYFCDFSPKTLVRKRFLVILCVSKKKLRLFENLLPQLSDTTVVVDAVH